MEEEEEDEDEEDDGEDDEAEEEGACCTDDVTPVGISPVCTSVDSIHVVDSCMHSEFCNASCDRSSSRKGNDCDTDREPCD